MTRTKAKNIKALIIAAVAIILIVAIALCVLYFGFPSVWKDLTGRFLPSDSDGDSSQGETQKPPLTLGEGEMKVHFADVGQGDCIYIQFPDGTDMIIDAGTVSSSETYPYSKTKEYLDTLDTDGKINHLMLTHCDQDHVEFLDDIIYDFEVENIYMPNVLASPGGTSNAALALKAQVEALDPDKLALFTDKDKITSQTYAKFFVAALTEENCEIHLNVDVDEDTNSIIIEESSYRFTFYCPTQEYYDSTNLGTAMLKNAISPVGILEYNNRRIVFTGDSNEGNEDIVAERIGEIDCDVLKVAHHGSRTSSSDEFLSAVTCEYAVISCNSKGNSYNHPTQAALDRFAARNMTVYRTDTNGTIVLTVDGEGNMSFSVQTEVEQSVNFVGADAEQPAAPSSTRAILAAVIFG